jgi:hypothetical protein
MSLKPLTQDDILEELHNEWLSSIDESGIPLYISSLYSFSPLSLYYLVYSSPSSKERDIVLCSRGDVEEREPPGIVAKEHILPF